MIYLGLWFLLGFLGVLACLFFDIDSDDVEDKHLIFAVICGPLFLLWILFGELQILSMIYKALHKRIHNK